ncbi:proteasome-type protease [Brucella anthropi]|uniref:Proteasome-type protease n=1 Tax=Brucella anthropi TaxID=529 RepID=A0A011TQ24_BRUAN|nr:MULTISPECIES: proteasome-type protease [Brucella/Ochrobactrum group]MCR5941958.1 peptidase [Ochrobactrum sp. XJ1]QOD65422.1 proteasome-type protease [Ochrobactrum sp. MT180101]QTN05038.1 peptidase [Ochrobactrum sp. EEELCW01]EXL06157.1 peptidase [Brucella anthropi]KAB2740261.1 proteasome-type protease [Brucella anthropi]
MTYCVGMKIDRGLVFMSDTRTNAGLDNISVFSKMRSWSEPGERVIVLLSAGNLATTQAVASLLEERMKAPADRHPSVFDAPSMFQVARLVGDTVKEVIQNSATGGQNADAFGASFILGGQIKGGQSRLFYIYPEGNFIESSADTPFFQIGENKYGKPILVRAYQEQMSFEEAVKLLLVSFDSTLKANLSVGLPLDMQIYEADSFETGARRRFEVTDPYYQTVSESWSEALKSALEKLPPFSFDE